MRLKRISDMEDGDTMNLTYGDVFAYLKGLQKYLQMRGSILNADLHVKKQRKKLYLEEGFLTSYGDILENCGLPRADTVALFHTLPDILNLINENTIHEKPHPILLSALVVSKKTLIPGNKYFERWHQYGHLSDNEKIELWSQDLKDIART